MDYHNGKFSFFHEPIPRFYGLRHFRIVINVGRDPQGLDPLRRGLLVGRLLLVAVAGRGAVVAVHEVDGALLIAAGRVGQEERLRVGQGDGVVLRDLVGGLVLLGLAAVALRGSGQSLHGRLAE